MEKVTLRFDGPPGPEAGRFIEAEIDGKSVNIGKWRQDGDDWLLVLDLPVAIGNEIKPLVRKLHEARLKELHERRNLAGAKHALERKKALVVQAAYDAGEINAKNKDTREAGEADVLARSEVYQTSVAQVEVYERAVSRAEIDRLALEDEVSLTRAWLYSLTRIR